MKLASCQVILKTKRAPSTRVRGRTTFSYRSPGIAAVANKKLFELPCSPQRYAANLSPIKMVEFLVDGPDPLTQFSIEE
jgi:hypothetical protein